MYVPKEYTDLSCFLEDYRIESYDKALLFLESLNPNFALPIRNEFGKIRVNKLIKQLNSTIALNALREEMQKPKRSFLDWVFRNKYKAI